MKNLKKALAVFMAAITVMVMFTGCGPKRVRQRVETVSLSDLRVINTHRWSWNLGTPTDTFGTDHSDGCNYVIVSLGEAYIEYRLEGKYSKLTGTIAPHENMGENGQGYVHIYADDKLVYSSPTVFRKTDPFDFSVDVSGADYIKIYTDRYTSSEYMIISDLKLWT